MRRLLALILSLSILFTFSACENASSAVVQTDPSVVTNIPTNAPTVDSLIAELNLSDMEKKELRYAAALGFPLDKLTQENISGQEMTALLDHFVGYVAPNKLNEWSSLYSSFRNDSAPLNRHSAMAALFLAGQTVEGSYLTYPLSIFQFFQIAKGPWDLIKNQDKYLKFELFSGQEWQNITYQCGDIGRNCYLDSACYYYNISHISSISGEYPFSYDAEGNTFYWDDDPTYAEVLLAIIRLISSCDDSFVYQETSADLPYLSMADQRREELRTKVTDCTEEISGTIYYISNDGDNDSNGRSPETAWATLAPLYTVGLRSGDAILFERGGTWYLQKPDLPGYSDPNIAVIDLEVLNRSTNVVIGAYGEGAKPVLRGDFTESNDPTFWELYSDTDGAKIWKSTVSMPGTNVIAFNDGEAWADQIFPWWDGNDAWITEEGKPFTVEGALSKDLTFTWLPEITEDAKMILRTSDRVAFSLVSPIYLRCDQGNPAEVYDAISIPQVSMAVSLNTNCSIIDMDLRYFTMAGANITGDNRVSGGQTYLNTEISWCGGFLMNYNEAWDGLGSRGWQPGFTGCGAMIASKGDVTVQDCYFHHCGSRSIVMHINGFSNMPKEYILENFKIQGNLFEESGSALHIADGVRATVPDASAFISNLVFEDNIVMNSGSGWIYSSNTQTAGQNTYTLSAVENAAGACHNDGILFKNNLFYRSEYALISLSDTVMVSEEPVNAAPIFSGNTYVQNVHRPFLQENGIRTVWGSNSSTLLEKLGDETGTLIVLE